MAIVAGQATLAGTKHRISRTIAEYQVLLQLLLYSKLLNQRGRRP